MITTANWPTPAATYHAYNYVSSGVDGPFFLFF